MEPVAHAADVTIGVDLGGTNVRAARVDRTGGIGRLVKVRTDSGPRVPDLIIELVRSLLDGQVVGVGIGIPGRVDREGRTVLSAGFVDLAGVRLGELVADAVGRPAVMDNDAHMALTAELARGAATGARDVVLFTVGTGIGGAFAVDGTVIRGRGNAGQLGHLTLDPDGRTCKCGRRGCSEVYASGTALAGLVKDAGLASGTTAQELLLRADRDRLAAHVLRRWAEGWRHAIDTAIAMLDPELVVLGGGLGAAAAASLERFAPPSSEWFGAPVVAAALGDDAGVIGAGLRALGAAGPGAQPGRGVGPGPESTPASTPA